MRGRWVICESCNGTGKTPTHGFRCLCGGTGGVWQREAPEACEQGARGGECGSDVLGWCRVAEVEDPGPDSPIGREVAAEFSAAQADPDSRTSRGAHPE